MQAENPGRAGFDAAMGLLQAKPPNTLSAVMSPVSLLAYEQLSQNYHSHCFTPEDRTLAYLQSLHAQPQHCIGIAVL